MPREGAAGVVNCQLQQKTTSRSRWFFAQWPVTGLPENRPWPKRLWTFACPGRGCVSWVAALDGRNLFRMAPLLRACASLAAYVISNLRAVLIFHINQIFTLKAALRNSNFWKRPLVWFPQNHTLSSLISPLTVQTIMRAATRDHGSLDQFSTCHARLTGPHVDPVLKLKQALLPIRVHVV